MDALLWIKIKVINRFFDKKKAPFRIFNYRKFGRVLFFIGKTI